MRRSRCETTTRRRRLLALRRCRPLAAGASLAAAADQDDRARSRPAAAPTSSARAGGEAPVGAARPAGLRREPRRRQRRDRPAGADAGRPGRLHHRDHRPTRRWWSIPGSTTSCPTQPLRDFVPVATHGALPRHAGRASVRARQERRRADRARQGQARRARLMRPPASAISAIWRWSCSRSRPASSCCTCPTRAPGRRRWR